MIITSLAVVMPTAASAAYIGSSSNMGVAGGVDEAERLVLEGDAGFDGVGGRAGDVGDDGAVMAEKFVEEA